MANYYASPTLAATAASHFGAIETALLAVGWTVLDTVSSTNKAYKSPVIANGVYFVFHMRDVGNLGLATMVDYDTSTHTDILPSGNVGGGGFYTYSAGTAYIYANPMGFTIVNSGAAHIFAGMARSRQIQGATDGLCLSTGTMAIGATTVNVNANLTGKLFVGQVVAIQNFAHNSASANASHTELVTITAVGASSLSFSATTKAYDSGAKIGPPDLLYLIGGSTNSVQAYNSSMYQLCTQAMDLGQNAITAQSTIDIFAGMQISTSTLATMNNAFTKGLAPAAFVPQTSSQGVADTSQSLPLYGFIFVSVSPSASVPPAGTKYTDGKNVFIQVVSTPPTGSGFLICVGPTGDAPNFSTMKRISSPDIAVNDTYYSAAVGAAPVSAFNQGLL